MNSQAKILNTTKLTENPVSYFRGEWQETKRTSDSLRNNVRTNVNSRKWANTMKNAANTDKLYIFRDALVSFIKGKICSETTLCKSYGTTKVTSNVDITLSNDEHIMFCFVTLQNIQEFLKNIFYDDTIFYYNGKFALFKVTTFFDINFYLSNFEIKRKANNNKLSLLNYYLSNNYNSSGVVPSQYIYAFYEYDNKNIRTIEASESNEYEIAVTKIEDLESKKLQDQSKIDELIDLFSIVSTFEDECYHTQGAFFHVVLMMQRGMNFENDEETSEVFNNMLSASIIENLCFAYTHPHKQEKYLSRVNDAYIKMTNKEHHVIETLKYICGLQPKNNNTNASTSEVTLNVCSPKENMKISQAMLKEVIEKLRREILYPETKEGGKNKKKAPLKKRKKYT